MYADIDELIADICTEYDILYIYDRKQNSTYDFLNYINKLKSSTTHYSNAASSLFILILHSSISFSLVMKASRTQG